MVLCMPIAMNGQLGGGWGRAHDVVVAQVSESGDITQWEPVTVRWDELHDEGGEGQHHARIAKFLMEHHVKRVIAGHMGHGMHHMLGKMGIDVVVDVSGDARELAQRYGR